MVLFRDRTRGHHVKQSNSDSQTKVSPFFIRGICSTEGHESKSMNALGVKCGGRIFDQ